MQIIHKHVKDLTPVEYRACYKANYANEGYMQEELLGCKWQNRPGEAILLWDGPPDKVSSLIGWCLLTPVRTWGLLSVSTWVIHRSKYTVQFWVKKQYRRQGYGKMLMNEVKRLDPNPHVIPHDKPSSELFSSYKVQVMKGDKEWIRRKPKVL